MAKSNTKKVYIGKSAYRLTVTNQLSSRNRIKGEVRVIGSLQSSSVRFSSSLFRGSTRISSYDRTGTVGPRSGVSFYFINVSDTGSLRVRFTIKKDKGTTRGSRTDTLTVPR